MLDSQQVRASGEMETRPCVPKHVRRHPATRPERLSREPGKDAAAEVLVLLGPVAIREREVTVAEQVKVEARRVIRTQGSCGPRGALTRAPSSDHEPEPSSFSLLSRRSRV